MILVADSGATKTDWFITGSDCGIISTIGLNPFFVSSDDITKAITDSEIIEYKSNINKVYFYGSGCSSEKGRDKIVKSLKGILNNATIEVDTDLLGACRSLFGNETGIAAILGTGSNSAVYSKGKILTNHPSLGFILGDEGSGSYLGKKFISLFLNGQLPHEISELFQDYYKITRNEILTKVYTEKFPNRFLASFTKFLGNNIENEIIRNLVVSGIDDFFKINLLKYSEIVTLPVRFTGSVSFYFSQIIIELGEKYNLNIDKIEKQPMDGLKRYHMNNQ